MTMQIKRRFGSGAPAAGDVVVGQLAYHKDTSADLYVGNNASGVDVLVSPTRQVEVAGNQTITGVKTFSTASFRLTGGANNNMLVTDGTGAVHWTSAPSGGLLSVATDNTLNGDGTDGDPLSVVHLATARNIGIQGGTNVTTGAITTITATAASFDGSANVTISAVNISLDDGTY